MKIQLRFDAYPYQESGANQNNEFQFKTGLKTQAFIITKYMWLLERLYYSIVKSTSLNK